MKGFYIEVSNDLLDPRHCKQMGDSVWLFMWFLDKMTSVTQEKGKVLGGKPIKFSEIETDLGISRSTYNRWMKTLKEGGYVQTVRTPYGSCIVVLKAKKKFKRPTTTDVSEMKQPIMTHQPSIASTNNDTSGVDNDTSLPPFSSGNDTSNKTVQNTDNTVDTAIVPSGPDDIGSLGLDSVTISEDTIGKDVNDAIALFLPYFPGDFVGKSSAFAKKPTRKAVEALLKRYSLDELKELLRKYDAKRTDKFRPEAGTVYEFTTFKLAKIESYLQKDGALWAQRSISTPEQRADSDSLIQKKLEAGRERTRLAKEEWQREHPTE